MSSARASAAATGLPNSISSLVRAPVERPDVTAVQRGELRSQFGDLMDVPETYAMHLAGDCLSPFIQNGTKVIVSSTETPEVGDFVVLYKRPEILRPGEFQAIIKRLVTAVPAWVSLPWDDHPQSTAKPIILAEQLNPHRIYRIPCSALLAIHKCVGTVRSDMVRMESGASGEWLDSRRPTHGLMQIDIDDPSSIRLAAAAADQKSNAMALLGRPTGEPS